MEDLQLALTPARVDQKNFGLWLKNWQVGQVLQALVTDKRPSGELVLRVGAQQITATSDIPIQKGARLMLEVTGLTPTPSLKVINAPIAGNLSGLESRTVPLATLSGHLQVLMPRQGRVERPLNTLLGFSENTRLLSLLGLKEGFLERLTTSLIQFRSLSDAKELRKAMGESGLFFESKLLQRGGVGIQDDVKVLLMKLLAQVKPALSRQASVAASARYATEQAVLLNLKRELEGAMATITLNQLASNQHGEVGGAVWLFDVPFQLQEKLHSLSLRIERDGRQAQGEDDDEEKNWNIVLSINLPQLGKIEAELFLRGSKVSVVMYSEQDDTAKMIANQLDSLKLGLQSRGLDVSVILSHRVSSLPGKLTAQWSESVDETV
ncbi:MAG: hypothetical protein ACJA09_000161 [Alcanivorax sp.]|jgi:hypothetical protein